MSLPSSDEMNLVQGSKGGCRGFKGNVPVVTAQVRNLCESAERLLEFMDSIPGFWKFYYIRELQGSYVHPIHMLACALCNGKFGI